MDIAIANRCKYTHRWHARPQHFLLLDVKARATAPLADDGMNPLQLRKIPTMNALLKIALSTLLLLCTQHAALAQDRGGTAKEAIALVKKAVDYLKHNGRAKALAEFSNTNGQFHDRALYLVVYDIKGVKVAHGVNQKMIGKNNLELKDVDGKYVIKDFIDVATQHGKGWIDYKWPNPVTGGIEPKSTYLERADDLIIGCGVYPGFFNMSKVHD